MGKIIISEQKLNTLINECVEEVMLEEGFRDTVGKAWNGIKQGAQAVGNGVKKFAKDPVGTAASVKGWYDQTKNRMQNRWKEAYNIARDKVRLQSADDSVWDKLDDTEKQALLQVRGTDKFGNWKFNAIRYAKAVEKTGKDANEIAQIMTQKGFKGITPQYVQQMLAVGRNPSQTSNNNGEMKQNPDVAQPQQQPKAQPQASGWGNMDNSAYMDEAINRAVSKAINEVISEVGDTVKGQKQLGKLAGKRIKQSWVYSETGDEEKSEDYGKRYNAADRKAKEERDKTDSQNKRRRMRNAYYKSTNKQVGK